MLEFELPEAEGQQGELPQGAEKEEDLPECPDHRPSTYVEGKPRSIISLLLFYDSVSYQLTMVIYIVALSGRR